VPEEVREREPFVVQYRSFRNTDPPGLMQVWNEAFTGRGAVGLRTNLPLERYVFAKPYFDPAGLIVAAADGVPVGFAHAGFGANDTETGLSTAAGTTCLIGVRPSYRGRGIGSELLQRCEAYLSGRGASLFYAGSLRPLNPFYLGLYGGSELPGFLESDAAAAPFFKGHGYQVWETAVVMQRRLDQPVKVTDGRFAGLRRRFEMQVEAASGVRSWWQECVLGPLEPLDFKLRETAGGGVVAHAVVYEMEGFSWRWNQPAVGLLDVQVREDLRRQGLARFLLAQLLRYLQDQFFGLAEVHALERDTAALQLFRGLGFEQVDVGHLYRR
jgi:ribosomal protein S18 acetylase RimI-like enzyme